MLAMVSYLSGLSFLSLGVVWHLLTWDFYKASVKAWIIPEPLDSVQLTYESGDVF